MKRGFMYLAAIMDWYSRYVLSWRLSNTLDAGYCVDTLEEALRKGRPKIFNEDHVLRALSRVVRCELGSSRRRDSHAFSSNVGPIWTPCHYD